MATPLEYENAVGERYAKAAEERESSLCCPVVYRQDLLDVIPQEIIDRDYGCGDPSPYVKAGDTVLDLGSGGGKLCYIASQLVGKQGSVIGVDCNPTMLQLARKYQTEVAEKIGYNNISFRAGMIQDLKVDLELFASQRDHDPESGLAGVVEDRNLAQRLSREATLIESGER